MHAAFYVVEVPYLVQLGGVTALNCHIHPTRCLQRSQYLRTGVCCGARWDDTCIGQPCMGRQSLEQVYSLVEVLDHLFLRHVVRVAARLKCRDTRAVFVPLMTPERLGSPGVGRPVCIHVIQKCGCARGREDGCDVSVLARRVAICIVGAVAAVGPGSQLSGRETCWMSGRALP